MGGCLVESKQIGMVKSRKVVNRESQNLWQKKKAPDLEGFWYMPTCNSCNCDSCHVLRDLPNLLT